MKLLWVSPPVVKLKKCHPTLVIQDVGSCGQHDGDETIVVELVSVIFFFLVVCDNCGRSEHTGRFHDEVGDDGAP